MSVLVPVTGITQNHGIDVHVACGHDFHYGGFDIPEVGSMHDCMTCGLNQWEIEHPPISVEKYEEVLASIPHCPLCGGQIDTIPFIQHTTQKFTFEIDRQNGEVNAYSEHYDTVEIEPNWELNTVTTYRDSNRDFAHRGKIEVTCEDGHRWVTDRLMWIYDMALHEHRWAIAPEASDGN